MNNDSHFLKGWSVPYFPYEAEHGRWASRDPIEEQGGVNLYTFVRNDGVGGVDITGLVSLKDILWEVIANGGADIARNLFQSSPIPPSGFRVAIDVYASGNVFKCCNREKNKIEYWGKATGGIEAYIIWGYSYKKSPQSSRIPRGSVPRGESRSPRNQWSDDPGYNNRLPGNFGKAVGRKFPPKEYKNKRLDNMPLPPDGFRGRDIHLDLGKVGDCPEPGASGTVSVFFRGSVGFVVGAQFNLSFDWGIGDSIKPDFNSSASIARGIYGASIEIGAGGSGSVTGPLPNQ